jgi:hypothetical protein
VYDNLCQIARIGSKLPPGVEIASDLLSVAEHLHTNESKFLTYIYAMEALVKRPLRSDQGVAWVEAALQNLKVSSEWVDASERDALISAIGALKYRSTRWALRDLARRARPGDKDVENFVDEAYTLRGDLVHPDRHRRQVEDLLPVVLALVQDEIRFLLDIQTSDF